MYKNHIIHFSFMILLSSLFTFTRYNKPTKESYDLSRYKVFIQNETLMLSNQLCLDRMKIDFKSSILTPNKSEENIV